MSETARESFLRRIESAIEQGGLEEARRLIESAELQLGQQDELAELRHRLAVVESTLSQRGHVEAAIRRAREEVSRANYHAALSVLETAVKVSPDNAELRELIQQTTKAALRHEAAVERNRAVAQSVEQIGGLIDRGELDLAQSELREANLRFGRHDALAALQQRLDARWKEVELERTVAFVDQARAFLDGGKWPDALRQADRILRQDPRNQEALEMKQRARAEMERLEAHRQAANEVELARDNVARLIAADELVGASRALQSAMDRLGRHEALQKLAGELDQAKSQLQARKRLEWTQRRLKEAEDLVRQADRLSLQGRHEAAIERLHQVRELNPNHPEIDDRLQAATTAHQRAIAERQRTEALATAKAEIRQLLDGLRLDEAERRIELTRTKFGLDEDELRPLVLRHARLRETEQGVNLPAAALDPQATSEALARQHELAGAYSWKQTLLYAFRGPGAKAFLGLVAVFVTLEWLAAQLPMGSVFKALRWLGSLTVLGLFCLIVRRTMQGRHSFPDLGEVLDLRRRGAELAMIWGVLLMAALAPAGLVLTRNWHGLFAAATGWGLLSALVWLSAALATLGCSAAGAFGHRFSLDLKRHALSFDAGAPEIAFAVHAVFALVVTVALLRATLLPFVPWIGSPLAVAVEVYALLEVPHLMGVVYRRHQIELARIYR